MTMESSLGDDDMDNSVEETQQHDENSLSSLRLSQHPSSNTNTNTATSNTATTTTTTTTTSTTTTTLVDITSFLEETSKSLTFEKPMLHNESFNLQDSMAALEIMDHKMDCCEIPVVTTSSSSSSPMSMTLPTSSEKSKTTTNTTNNNQQQQPETTNQRMIFPRPTPTGLDDDISPLPWNELTIEDTFFITMENLIRFESLLNGSSVLESTYTCLYAHKGVLEDMYHQLEPFLSLTTEPSLTMRKGRTVPMDVPIISDHNNKEKQGATDCGVGLLLLLSQHIVFASTILLVELTDLCRSIIFNADIYQEEDFATGTFNIPSFQPPTERFGTTLALHVSSMIQEELAKYDKEEKQQQQQGMKNTISYYYLEAIKLMLGFQMDLIGSVSVLSRLSGKTIRKEVELSQVLAKRAKKNLEDALGVIFTTKLWKENHPSESTKIILRRVFDSFVNRPLVGNAPVRMIEFVDATDAMHHLIQFAKEIDWNVCNMILKANNLGRIVRMMRTTSSASANIVTRSLLVLNLYFGDLIFGQYSLPHLILGYIQQLSNFPESFIPHSSTQAFLTRLCKPVYDTLKLMALNRNRQRTYIDELLGDWSVLREEAYVADMTCHQESGRSQKMELQPYFSVYVLTTTMELMDQFVDLGVELQLFCNEHEMTVAYWYRDFLLSSMLTQLNTMRRYKVESLQSSEIIASTTTVKTQKSGKKKGKNKKQHTNNNGTNHHHHSSSSSANRGNVPTAEDLEEEVVYLLLNAKRFLCRGLVQFLVSLRQAGLVQQTEYEFTSDRLIYEKRFEPFMGIHQPPILTYDDFLKGSDPSTLSQDHLVTASSESFSLAKSLLEKALVDCKSLDSDYIPASVEEMNQLVKVCVGNSIYLHRLVQICDSSQQQPQPQEASLLSQPQNTKITLDMTIHKQFCTIKLIS